MLYYYDIVIIKIFTNLNSKIIKSTIIFAYKCDNKTFFKLFIAYKLSYKLKVFLNATFQKKNCKYLSKTT